jgi:Tol biopolymer transport system component
MQTNQTPASSVKTPSTVLTYTKPQQSTATPKVTYKLLDPTLVPIQRRMQNHLTRSCIQIINNANQDEDQNNSLVLYDRNRQLPYLYDKKNDEALPLNNANKMLIDISPNYRWLVYLQEIGTNSQLIVQSFSGENIYKIKLASLRENATLGGWVGDENIILSLSGHQPASILVVNPFTNEQQILTPNFPDIYNNDAWDWSFSGRTIYSPDFRFVVYPATFGDAPTGDVLWDAQNRERIAIIPIGIGGNLVAVPQWSPDWKFFAVKVMGRNADELYSASLDGTVTGLTNLLKLFPDVTTQIRTWKWSPDSQKIAFWLDFYDKDILKEERLMVIDIKSGEITDYCLSGDNIQITTEIPDFTPAPAWSPDSAYLLVEQRKNLTESTLILMNLEKKTASSIGKNTYPYGWMKEGP